MWHLNCTQFPKSIHKLNLMQCGNIQLYETIFTGIKHLEHLDEICIPVHSVEDLIESPHHYQAFPNHRTLKRLILFPRSVHCEFRWSTSIHQQILKSTFLSKVQARIKENGIYWTSYANSTFDIVLIDLVEQWKSTIIL